MWLIGKNNNNTKRERAQTEYQNLGGEKPQEYVESLAFVKIFKISANLKSRCNGNKR